MKSLVIAAVGLLLLYIAYRTYRYTTTTKGLKEKIACGAVILDVRTRTEFETGHISGALNLPLGELRTGFVTLDSGKTYITTCSHGLRSVKARNLLKERGFHHVFNGGAWSDLSRIVQEKRNGK